MIITNSSAIKVGSNEATLIFKGSNKVYEKLLVLSGIALGFIVMMSQSIK